ncbi:hypothetical protein ACG1BZ_09350 [Microbulbifer sp. CNSA002]|uniref:hypothetical protein n=1 Tax=Microbulbifer sp. CNSA002 TaxID=3373604 RepID=UPI0039B64100
MRLAILLISLIISGSALSDTEGSKYFVFIGQRISLEPVPPKEGEVLFDSQFLATYRIVDPYRGAYQGSEIEFTVFDHYGRPPFSNYEHVLLYVVKHDGRYYHSKYQFTPVYKTKSGKWAGAYAVYDYTHSYNENTKIKPVRIEFSEPVVIDITGYEKEDIIKWFPEPYYKIEGGSAVAVYGNYIDELFLLKQNGVLKARGDFQ